MIKTGLGEQRFLLPVVAASCLFIILSWLPQLLTFNPGISYGDEGFIAQAAKRVVNGQWPYRDFFTGVPPFAAWWYGLFLLILGKTFLALRIGVLATAALILLTALWALSRLTPRQLAPAVCLLAFLAFFGGPYWFIASHHWVSLLFCLVSLALLLPDSGTEIPACKRVFWAGVAAGGAALTLQHKGGLWLLAASFALAAVPKGQRRQLLARFWLGALAIGIPTGLLFILVAGFDQLVYQLVTFPLTRYHLIPGHRGTTIFADLWTNWQNVSAAWPAPGSGVSAWLPYVTWNLGFFGRALVHLFLFLGGAAIVSLWLHRSLPRLSLALLTAFFTAAYLATLHRFHETTLVFAAPAAVLVLAVWVGAARGGWRRSAVKWVVIAWVGLFSLIAVGFMLIEFLPGKVTVRMPAGAVDSLYPAEAQELAGVNAFFREHRRPGDGVLCLTYLPIFYFLLDLENPTPYDILTYPLNSPEQFDEVRSKLEAQRTRWILWDQYSLGGTGFGQYLLRNYQVRAHIGKLAVLERKPPPLLPE